MNKKPRTPRKGIHFTERDGLTIQAVFRARYLTNTQVRDLLYTPTTYGWCKQRLKYLYDKGYLDYRQASIISPFVYFLALKGRRYIAGLNGEWSKEQIDRIAGVAPKEDETADLMIRHDLDVSGLYVSAYRQCQANGWELVWENARMLEIRKLGVQPDAYLRVEQGGTVLRRAFIEFTEAMPDYRAMKKKLNLYRPVLQNLGDALVLWVTPTLGRLEKLYRWTKDYDYRQWVCFGLLEDRERFLTERVWLRHGSERKVGLTAPKEVVEAGASPPAQPGLITSAADPRESP